MHPIKVQVFRGEQLIDERERNLRRTPDDRIGVDYQGVVYPLINGTRIDILGKWFYPQECQTLLEEPAELTLSIERESDIRWHLDSSGYYVYVMLDGDEATADAAVKALNAAGFPVSRMGTSFRPADNDETYDWFIRLDVEKRRPNSWEINEVIRHVPEMLLGAETQRIDILADDEELSYAVLRSRLRRALEQIEVWQERVIRAERDLGAAEHELKGLHERFAEREREFQRDKRLLEDRLGLFRAALKEYEIKAKQFGETDPKLAEEINRLREQVMVLKEQTGKQDEQIKSLLEDYEQVMAAWEEAETKNGHLTSLQKRLELEREDLLARLEKAEFDLNSIRAAAQKASGNKRRREKELADTIENLLPNIRLIGGSASFITVEVFALGPLFRDLRKLDSDPAAISGKKVHGARGWRERHFSTGQSNDGRLYYRRRRNGNDEICEVLVSDKHDQSKDIAYLQRL